MDNIREKLVDMMKKLGIEYKIGIKTYTKPYLENYDSIPYLSGFRVLNFTKFIGEDNRMTWEHVDQFIV